MKLIKLDQIVIPDNRQRRTFDEAKLAALATSILKLGLLHPIVVRYDQKLQHVLVAGERRFRALLSISKNGRQIQCNSEQIPLGIAPCIMLADLSDLEIREAELEENVIREDLTLQERAAAVDALHSLRLEQTDGAQTQGATAEEISGSSGSSNLKVRDMILIHKHCELPDVQAAKTPREAMKAIRKVAEKDFIEFLGENYDLERSDSAQIICGDSSEVIMGLEDEAFDCILTDPPYGIGADSFGDMSAKQHSYYDSEEVLGNIMLWFPEESYRVAKREAHLYMFCDIRLAPELIRMLSEAGWAVWPKPLIWYKGDGMVPQPDYGPWYTYEAIIFANKGKKMVVTAKGFDVINIRAILSGKRVHAAEKPVALFKNLLERSCISGDRVLDPFAGSGPIFPAAKALSLEAVGIEQSEEAVATCKARINETLEQ